jgi:hypothetical protein
MLANLHSAFVAADMDLTTNGVVLTDAIEFIEWSNEKLNFLQKKEEEDNEDY